MLEIIHSGYVICIGENRNENDELVRAASPEDGWAHIRFFPSAHAIIRNPSGKRIPRTVIKRACCVIKSRSNQCKSVKDLEFDVTRIKNVIPTDTPGLVTLKGQPTLVVI